MSTNRRAFLGTVAAGVAAAQLPLGEIAVGEPQVSPTGRAAKKLPPKPKSTDPCGPVPLTETITCSRIGFGTGMRGGNRESNITRMGAEKAKAILSFAYEQGVRLFDCADLYGSHSYVAAALEGKPRDSYTLVSKLWVRPGGIPEPVDERPEVDVQVERFLKELKTDHIDLVQLHCMDSSDWPGKYAKQMDILSKLKEQGKIRAHGVSTHSCKAVIAAAENSSPH